jgi:hypothetical protein
MKHRQNGKVSDDQAGQFPKSFIWMYLELTKDQTNPINPDKVPSPAILIILMGSLGDIIRALCLICHLKSHWPQSRISWLVEARWAELIRLHRQIDKVIIFRREWRVFSIVAALQRTESAGFRHHA